jgi:hypothetical protein
MPSFYVTDTENATMIYTIGNKEGSSSVLLSDNHTSQIERFVGSGINSYPFLVNKFLDGYLMFISLFSSETLNVKIKTFFRWNINNVCLQVSKVAMKVLYSMNLSSLLILQCRRHRKQLQEVHNSYIISSNLQ